MAVLAPAGALAASTWIAGPIRFDPLQLPLARTTLLRRDLGWPSISAMSEARDQVNGKHELAAAVAVVIGSRTECVLIADFGTNGEQRVEAVRDSHGPTRVSSRKARPLALHVDEVVNRANRKKILFRKLPFGVIDNANCGCVSGNQRSRTYAFKPGMRRPIIHGSTDQCVELIDVICLRRGKECAGLVEPVRPRDVGLLEIVVSVFEVPVVDRVD